jgi:hypothetical protein
VRLDAAFSLTKRAVRRSAAPHRRLASTVAQLFSSYRPGRATSPITDALAHHVASETILSKPEIPRLERRPDSKLRRIRVTAKRRCAAHGSWRRSRKGCST